MKLKDFIQILIIITLADQSIQIGPNFMLFSLHVELECTALQLGRL